MGKAQRICFTTPKQVSGSSPSFGTTIVAGVIDVPPQESGVTAIYMNWTLADCTSSWGLNYLLDIDSCRKK